MYSMVTFVTLQGDPGPALQPIAEAHVVYVYVLMAILLFILVALPWSWVIAICPEGMNRKISYLSCLQDIYIATTQDQKLLK